MALMTPRRDAGIDLSAGTLSVPGAGRTIRHRPDGAIFADRRAGFKQARPAILR
jgi:hypothetical protein